MENPPIYRWFSHWNAPYTESRLGNLILAKQLAARPPRPPGIPPKDCLNASVLRKLENVVWYHLKWSKITLEICMLKAERSIFRTTNRHEQCDEGCKGRTPPTQRPKHHQIQVCRGASSCCVALCWTSDLGGLSSTRAFCLQLILE